MHKKVIEGYLQDTDWRKSENSNINYSVGGLILHNSGNMVANYWLKQLYTPEIAEAHESAAFHIHDLGFFGSYCFTEDSQFVLEDGTSMSFKEAREKGITSARVKTYNVETGEIEVEQAINIGIRGEDDIYQVELEDGSIVSGFTKDHQFLTKNRGYVKAEDLTEEDELIVA